MASSPSTSIRRVRQAELARELGVSRQAIADLVKRGIISTDADGMIDAELAKIALQQRVRPSGKTAQAMTPAPPPPLPAPVPPPAEKDVDPASATSFHVARTLREAEEARMARMKRQQMEGSLIEREPAVTAVFTAYRQLRDTAMPVGRRVATRVATMTDAREIQLLIEAELRSVFATFAERTLANLTTAMTGAAVPIPADNPAAPDPEVTP